MTHLRLMAATASFAAGLSIGSGCGGNAPPVTDQPAEEMPVPPDLHSFAFAPELGVVLDSMTRTEGGVFHLDVQPGRGVVADSGNEVTIAYQAWLPDGTLYEERPSAGGWGPSEFIIGENPPVAGLSEGIIGMRVGGIRRIVVPPELGYGLVGRPEGVPPGSPLVFQVRLRNVAVATAPAER